MDVTRFCKTRWLFVIILIVLYFAEAWLVSYRDHDIILQASTSDEAMFLYKELPGYQKFFLTLDPKIFPNGFPWPYGHPFWLLLLAVYDASAAFSLSPEWATLLFFLGLKYVAAMFWRETLVLRLDPVSASALSLALLTSPGLFFYGKIISPEYQVLALVSAGLYFSLRRLMQGRCLSWMGLVLLFLATYTKLTSTPFFAAAWLAAGYAAYRKGTKTDAVRLLSLISLIFGVATLLACWAGGVAETIHSFLKLQMPPAIFTLEHLWHNIFNCPPFTWDQVLLLPLATAFPILFVAMIASLLSIIIWRGHSLRKEAQLFLWLTLLSTLATLLLWLAKSMPLTWYFFAAATTAPIAMFLLAGQSLKRRVALITALVSITVGVPASIRAIQVEIQKRALLLDGEHRAPTLIAAAQEMCGSEAHVVLDMLIPARESADRLMLRNAVNTPDVNEAIANKKPIVLISHDKVFTELPAAVMRFGDQANTSFEIRTDSRQPGYVFRVSKEGCLSR